MSGTPHDTWPARAAAAKLLGISLSTMDRWIADEKIKGVRHEDGSLRFDPADLNELRPRSEPSLVQELVLALKASNAHAVSLVNSVTGPAEKLLALYGSEAQAMRTRIETLEARNLQMLEVFELAVSAKHTRDLEIMRHEQSEKRKTQGMDALLRHAPTLASQALGAKGLRDLWETFDAAQLQALSESGFLSDEQRALLASIKRPKGKPNGTTES